MFVNGDDDPLHRHVELLGGCADDAQVGLVRHEPVQVVLVDVIFFQGFTRNRVQCCHGPAKNGIAVHLDVRLLRAQDIVAV